MAITLSNDDEPRAEPAMTDGPGSRLKKARVEKKLEVEDVAGRLRLHVRTIQSIEADDYEHLPAPTFVRGYLRGYARIVDLPADSIVNAYDENDFGPPPLVPDISSREETKSTDFPVRLATYAVIGVLVLLVVLWWQSGSDSSLIAPLQQPLSDDTASGAVVNLQTQEISNLPEADAAIFDEPNSLELDTTPSETAQTIEDTSATLEAATTIESGTLDELGESVEATIIEEAAGVTQTPGSGDEPALAEAQTSLTAIEPSINTSSEPIPRLSPARVADGSTLSLTLAKESWLEIYDADGKRLFYDLAKPDTPITITESGPFRLIIGYAQDAVLRYNGDVVDLAPYTFAGVAKLDVGANPSAAGTQATDQL